MTYKTREGVILEKICGEYRLIATLDARKFCPVASALNEDSAMVWTMMQDGLDTEEMVHRIVEKYSDLSNEEAGSILETFIRTLIDQGYVLEEVMNSGGIK